MREAVRDWADSSSCHGIPHMAQAATVNTFCSNFDKKPLNQCLAAILWSIILAFCAVGFVFLFTDTFRQYLRFDKVVQLNGLHAQLATNARVRHDDCDI
ncbi:unnamed protein product [Strongylus vulgaris]|uniref:Uncharacterized protein n=1 Tax=Strongylus vulgaris TaxID=40348 RepID=A0A3P7IVC6_STRVU|nr:unnamed protein product [Strongylus vulgaris]